MPGPRLLDKKMVTAEIATQRKQQIDQGITLAKKVDTVRATLAEEEERLEMFRHETLKRIQSEIDIKQGEYEWLQGQVRTLEERRVEALKGVEIEKEEVLEMRKELQNEREELEIEKVTLNNRSEEIKKHEKEALTQKQRADSMHDRAETFLAEADVIKGDAEQKDRQADTRLREADIEASAKTANAEQKEKSVQERENTVSQREAALITREIEVENSFRRLRDREATLERNLKRIKK